MARISPLFDEWGVIRDAMKCLPYDELKLSFLESLAELEDHECHRTRKFPKTRLHLVVGYREAVYRADSDKMSGWRLHLQYEDRQIHLSPLRKTIEAEITSDKIPHNVPVDAQQTTFSSSARNHPPHG